MRRRDLIILAGTRAMSWPVAARGQQSAVPVSARSSAESAPHVAFFLRGLNEAGYVAGQNVTIDYRWADGHYDRLPRLASNLANRRVSVLAAIADPAPQVAKEATHTIPIVFAINGDPIGDGLVASLNRPGGNAMLGHSSLAMTMRYAHLAPEHLRTAVLTSTEPTKDLAQEPVETGEASQK